MDTCNLKWIFILVCILIALVGLYLAFSREKINIGKDKPDIQDGSGNLKDGSFSFKFATGLVLIIVGLVGGYYSIINLPGCNEKATLKTAELSQTKFFITSEESDFAVVSSIEGKYVTDGNFIRGSTNISTIRLRSTPKHYNGKRFIFSLRIGIANYLPSGSFQSLRYSEVVSVNKFVAPDQTLTIKPFHFVIPISDINVLSSCHLIGEITQSDSTKLSSRTGTSYIHSQENIKY